MKREINPSPSPSPRRAQSGLDRLRSLLVRWKEDQRGSAGESCLTCQGTLKGAGNPLGLCAACFQAIPWITEIRCPVCGRPEDCPDCLRGHRRDYQLSRSAVRYNPLMKEWLARYKYRGDERFARLLGTMLHHAYALIAEGSAARKDRPFDGVTFVPVSRERLLERGFNQAERMAHELARLTGLSVYPLLLRTHSTVKQSLKSRSQRFLDLRDAFAPNEAEIVRLEAAFALTSSAFSPAGPRLLLVDDVYTTGSTMQQCSSVLRTRLGAEVCGLTWAR
ncbi:ComF family protein [Gorillibacterium sp. sgz500922]|uniref:ComF family protein n=1 Tax=Gorillibacterium sp. sgz500922 TaxID=3446694 RepID=UPI003F675129